MTEEIKVIPTNGTSADDVKYAKRVEEIYIDGVKVSECCFYNSGKCDNPNGMACNCINNAVCYFKELKQAENTVNECHKYLAELEDKIECLEQENKELKQENIRLFNESIELRAKNIEYKFALEEIREKAKHCEEQDACALCEYCNECALPDEFGIVYDNNKLIINKINEVLNESN